MDCTLAGGVLLLQVCSNFHSLHINLNVSEIKVFNFIQWYPPHQLHISHHNNDDDVHSGKQATRKLFSTLLQLLHYIQKQTWLRRKLHQFLSHEDEGSCSKLTNKRLSSDDCWKLWKFKLCNFWTLPASSGNFLSLTGSYDPGESIRMQILNCNWKWEFMDRHSDITTSCRLLKQENWNFSVSYFQIHSFLLFYVLIIITVNVCLEKKHRLVGDSSSPGSIYKLLHSASFLFAYTNVKLNACYIYIRELICDFDSW